MKKVPGKAARFAQTWYGYKDSIWYRVKTESRWEVGKHTVERNQKIDILHLKIILFLSLGQERGKKKKKKMFAHIINEL